MKKVFIILTLLMSLTASGSSPVIWNGTNAKFLNSSSVIIPGLTAHGVMVAEGSSAVSSVQSCTTGQVLTCNSNGAADPSFSSAGTGTVTSVTYTGDGVLHSSTPSSAVTASGTLTASLKTQTATTILAGPTSGSAATPTFRALAVTDLPVPTHVAYVTNTGTDCTVFSMVPSGWVTSHSRNSTGHCTLGYASGTLTLGRCIATPQTDSPNVPSASINTDPTATSLGVNTSLNNGTAQYFDLNFTIMCW